MRYFRRLYFENRTTEDGFVAIIDKQLGNYDFNTVFDKLSSPSAAVYLYAAQCYFKLPIGATAVVDIYIPNDDKSLEPMTFDFEIRKAKRSKARTDADQAAIVELRKAFEQIPSELFNRASPTIQPEANASGGFQFRCSTGASCNGQTDRECDDPLNMHAECISNQLECISDPGPGI